MMIRAPVLSNKLPYLLYNQGTRAKTAGKHPEQKSKQILTKLLLVRPRPASRLKVLVNPIQGEITAGASRRRPIAQNPRGFNALGLLQCQQRLDLMDGDFENSGTICELELVLAALLAPQDSFTGEAPLATCSCTAGRRNLCIAAKSCPNSARKGRLNPLPVQVVFEHDLENMTFRMLRCQLWLTLLTNTKVRAVNAPKPRAQDSLTTTAADAAHGKQVPDTTSTQCRILRFRNLRSLGRRRGSLILAVCRLLATDFYGLAQCAFLRRCLSFRPPLKAVVCLAAPTMCPLQPALAQLAHLLAGAMVVVGSGAASGANRWRAAMA